MPPELPGQSLPLSPPNPPQNQPGSSSLPSSQLPSQQLTPLFVSQETIDQLARSKDEPSKLPPLVPGHFANTFSFPVPKKVDDAIKQFRYVNYSLLCSAHREREAREEQSLVVSNGRIEVSSRSMHPADEGNISYLEWQAASKTVEKRMLHFHGEARTESLKQHHANVAMLALRYAWPTAQIYDKTNREFVAMDPQHDIAALNIALITEATLVPRLALPDAGPTRNAFSPPYPPSSSSQASLASAPAKRYHPYDQSGRQPKSSRNNQRCFRCGATGHQSATCDSKLTLAGLPCPSWSKRPGYRAGSLRDESSGRFFCVAWELSSDCRFSDRCKGSHRCSVCGERDHGVNACPKC